MFIREKIAFGGLMDLNLLLTDYEPPPPPEEYWFRHVYQLYRLGLPMRNPYPEYYFAHACIKRATLLILELSEQHGKFTEEAFTDALGRAISEVKHPNSARRQT